MLYRFLAMDPSAAALAAMGRYMNDAKAHQGHRFRLEDYGLDHAAVFAAFARPDQPAMFGGADVSSRGVGVQAE